jgi:hypothetical protein
MIEFKKDWWKLLLPGVLGFVGALIINQCSNTHNDRQSLYAQNHEDHMEIVRGCVEIVDKAKKEDKSYTDARYDSILLILKEQQSKIDAIYTYILNHNR